MAPGVIGMAVLFSSVFSGIALLWDRQFGFLKETLVAPVPRIEIMIGRTLGSATTSTIQGLLVAVVCLIAGFRPISLAMVPVALLFLLLIAILFAALGTTIGSSHPRHAGVSDRHELPCAADLLSVWCAVSARSPAEGFGSS